MNANDFCCIRNGVLHRSLNRKDLAAIKPFEYSNGKKQSALLMLHGFSSTPALYRGLVSQLTHYDALIVPALPGHADSLNHFSKVKAAEWLAFSENLCRELISQFERVDVMGLSLGGLLACHLSASFRLNHLYLLAPALNLQLNVARNFKITRFFQALGFEKIRNMGGNIADVHTGEITYRQVPLSTVLQVLAFVRDFKLIIPTCPTDLFLGKNDPVVASKEVAARFTGHDNVQIHWLPHSSHILSLDIDRQMIIDCLSE